jgi:hypothetical protein
MSGTDGALNVSAVITDRGVKTMKRHGTNRLGSLGAGLLDERRLQLSVSLTQLTVEDGLWLERALPGLMRRTRPQAGAVRVEDIVLRYRPGRLGVADALDATAALLEPFATAGAELDPRNDWYVADEDDEDDEELFEDDEHARLGDSPEQDLLVSARVVVDAIAEDAGAAALYWAALALAD